jgi:TonB-linked SusC/RagA family outer membrane protein
MKLKFLDREKLRHAAAVLLLCAAPAISAADITVSGNVSGDGEPLIGASVFQADKTANAVVTDIDGNYSLKVPEGASLTFSYVGYKSRTVKLDGRFRIDVELMPDATVLDEVVAIGYGVQQKRLITGATLQVKGDDIASKNTISAMGALQSQAPGVNIVKNTGKAGDGFKVNIRGLGTIYNSSPLVVIDGMSGGDLNLLSPSDIESIDVLKDAASAAIYGARAANGVILVTTKKGAKDRVRTAYNMYVGWQSIPKTVTPLNAQQYIEILRETGLTDEDLARNVYTWDDIQSGEFTGTNWLNEIKKNNAFKQGHNFSVDGGSERSTYSVAFSYASEKPTIGVKRSDVEQIYERFTIRANSEVDLVRHNKRSVLKFGENLTMAYVNSTGMAQGTGNMYWNDVRNALCASPLFPVYENPEKFGWPVLLDSDETNPVAEMYYLRSFTESKNYNARGNLYLILEPIRDLRFKTTFGFAYNGWRSREYVPEYQINEKLYAKTDKVTQGSGNGIQYSWDNTLSYDWAPGRNRFTFLVGNSIEKWGLGADINGSNRGSEFSSFEFGYLSNIKTIAAGSTTLSGAPWGRGSLASFFGRVTYDYDMRYMATVVMRADGSSNFARGHRWGYFPSVSAGWNIAEEHFMESTRTVLDMLKLRASWGENGNCNIPAFRYLSTIAFGNATNAAWYYFGDDKSQPTIGAYPDLLANPNLKWETSRQTDIGFDLRMLGNRLGVTFDWYEKKTLDWLVQPTGLGIWGTGAPYINGGDIKNTGVELSLSWNDNVGDFTYGVNVNLTHNRNKVLRIANGNGLIEGNAAILAQNTGAFYRAEEGKPLGYFYGYRTAGIFQNQEQIDSYISEATGLPIMPAAKPGDVIFVDTDGDGTITTEDRTDIGNPYPDLTYGININLAYKGFDLAVNGYGVAGNQIARSYRSGTDKPYDNYTTEILGRWTGEGTSNRLPAINGSAINWQYVSDLYIEDGDYFRITNITLGYDFKSLFPRMPLQRLRVYGSVQNPFTFTRYSGMDPEIGYGGGDAWASGIDLGYYPGSRSYLVGLSIEY